MAQMMALYTKKRPTINIYIYRQSYKNDVCIKSRFSKTGSTRPT